MCIFFQYLALQDLMLLSQYSPSRRQEVFSLSQPGIAKSNKPNMN